MGHKNGTKDVMALKVLIFGSEKLHIAWKGIDSTML